MDDLNLNERAVKDLRTLLEAFDTKGTANDRRFRILRAFNSVKVHNPALRDMIFELERKYVHKDRFDTTATLKVYDSDMDERAVRDLPHTER